MCKIERKIDMLEGRVIKSFNDKQNNLKHYEANGKTKFRAEDKRYNELKVKGFVEEGKEVATKNNKQVRRWLGQNGMMLKIN